MQSRISPLKSREPGEHVPAAQHVLRVASYNIHSCVGTDGRHDPDRVAAVILDIAPDVMGLQEVDSRYRFEHGIDQIDYLERSTGMRAVAGPTLIRHSGSYGNALLTRLPVRSVRRIDLTVGGREPRGALDVDLEAPEQIIRVVATHFGLGPWERQRQVTALLHLLHEHVRPVTVLLGDFNEWVPMRSTLRRISAHLGRSRSVRTFPSRWPALALDRVWIKPRHAAAAVWAHYGAPARVASDHLPICMTLRLPARAA